MAEKARLSWLNQASDRTSFWSGNKRVRALVQELDLDPLVRRFDGALYCEEKKFFVQQGSSGWLSSERLTGGGSS